MSITTFNSGSQHPPNSDHPPEGVHHMEPVHNGEAAGAAAKSLLTRARSTPGMIMVGVVAICSGYWIALDVYARVTSKPPFNPSNSAEVKPAPGPVGVKVTKDGQAVCGGIYIHVFFEADYLLDGNGETELPASFRGMFFEVKDTSGKSLYKGTIPDTGPLDIKLT